MCCQRFYRLGKIFEAILTYERRKKVLILVAAINLHTLRLKQDEYFGALHHFSLGLAAMLSPLIFTTSLTLVQWVLVVINVLAAVPIPSHHAKDDEDANFQLLPIPSHHA